MFNTRSAGPRAHPDACSLSNSADTWIGKQFSYYQINEHLKRFTSAGSPDSRTLKLSSLFGVFKSTCTWLNVFNRPKLCDL